MNIDKKIQLLNRILLIPAEEWEWIDWNPKKLNAVGIDISRHEHRISSVYINNIDVDFRNFTYFQTHLNGVEIRLILDGAVHIFQIGNVEIANWNGENRFVLSFSQRITLRVTRYWHEQQRLKKEKVRLEQELNPVLTAEQIELDKLNKIIYQINI